MLKKPSWDLDFVAAFVFMHSTMDSVSCHTFFVDSTIVEISI